MSRLPPTPITQTPLEAQSRYAKITGAESGLGSTYQALFANPQIASKLAELDEIISEGDLEPWIKFTVALTVAKEREATALWDSFEPLARESGVSDAVIDGIAAGTAPRRLLPKEGIWIQFTLEVIRDQMRDSTWEATTHLVGDSGAARLAFIACYYEMMARLNRTFALDTA